LIEGVGEGGVGEDLTHEVSAQGEEEVEERLGDREIG